MFRFASPDKFSKITTRLLKKIAFAGLLILATGQQVALTRHREHLSDGCFAAISTTAKSCPEACYHMLRLTCLLSHSFNSNTGKFCDTSDRQRWDEPDLSDSGELCTDCRLGNWIVHLESPFGHDEVLDQEFHSATSRCKATLFDLITPTVYALSSSTAVKAAYDEEQEGMVECTELDSFSYISTVEGDAHARCRQGTRASRAGLHWADL
ncbi:hypothetical protein G7046_g7600 [Stylonectria norvegica]|nr:hypothetical protein G7046_g7600 [Stylonectria norvegica]